MKEFLFMLLVAAIPLGLPVGIIALLFGKKFGDGTGNESGIAEFWVYCACSGAVVFIVFVVIFSVWAIFP